MSSSGGSDSDFTVGGDSKRLSSHGDEEGYSDPDVSRDDKNDSDEKSDNDANEPDLDNDSDNEPSSDEASKQNSPDGSKEGNVHSAEETEEEEMPKRKRRIKISDETVKFLESANILRRSSRQKEIAKATISDAPRQSRRPKRRLISSSNDGDTANESSSEASTPPHKIQKRKRRNDESSDDGDSETARPRRRKGGCEKSRINYRDISSGEEINSDDVLEWDEGTADSGTHTEHSGPGAEVIEKVLRHRAGYPGATGACTTCYNVEDKGDPNVKVAESAEKANLECQFLIKWTGWSHLHNTWESENSLKAVNAKGLKKVDNYLKRLREIENWKQTADKEYIEFFDCEQEMNDELFEQYKIVERVIAHQVSREKGETEGTEYLVKWCGLPYSDCTWEEEHLISRRFQDKIDAYHARRANTKTPSRSYTFTKKRPKFEKIQSIPSYLQRRDDSEHELRDYQLEGVNWMLHAWSKGNSCILADEMGLGKTIQSIAFISVLYHQYDIYGPFLVVVPLSTMASWQHEFEIWAADINMITYVGDVTSRDLIRQFEIYVQGSKRMKANVVLTTYEILLKDKAFLGSFEWALLAVDEAHRLKNDESLLYRSLFNFTTKHRLLITGTPLQNSLKELWALLHFIMDDKFDSWPDFEKDHHDSDHKAIASLHRKLQPFLLRRVKKDVEKSLPAKVEQILRVDMTAQQKQFYKWILTKNYKELSKGVKNSINGFVNIVMELKKCCNHASLVRAYDECEEEAEARLQQLLKSSGKLILLDKLLCRLQETGHRVLIFSQMVMMLDIIQEYLQLRRFTSQRLDGSMRSDLRKAALDHFNAPNSNDFCFLLSTRAGGLGINLATADTVIIFDSDWNPQNDLQAMSRAHRIGQKKQVNIYRLVTKASVEEEIVERAKRKLVLDHLVIQRMDTTGKTVLSKSSAATTGTGTMPFDKHELSVILKFGAEELFREKEGEEQEPEVDIDRILQGAETRECDQQDTGSELLNAFRYADFTFDENKDVPTLNLPQQQAEVTEEGSVVKSWDEIIPEAERQKYDERERERAEKELFLGPRQRTKVPEVAAEAGDSDEDDKGKKRRKRGRETPESDEEGSEDDKPKKSKKKTIFNFTEAEVRKFVKSFRKFAEPLTRLEAIAQDAELEEFSKTELEQLGNELLNGCLKAQKEYAPTDGEKKVSEDGKKKQDRGPIYKLGNIDVYVRPLLKMQADLVPLNDLVKSASDVRMLQIPGHPKLQKGWDVSWEIEDDVALLKGIYRYGLGSWEAIKMDPDYGLADKIWLKDKSKKPQGKHVQARAEYLLKYLARYARTLESSTSKVQTSAKKKHNDVPNNIAKEKKNKLKKGTEKEPRRVVNLDEKHSNEKKESKQKSERPSINLSCLTINKKYKEVIGNKESAQFKGCVKIMRPIRGYMKKLVKSEDFTTASSLRYLLKLGDYVCAHLQKLSESKSEQNIEKWHSYLWIFISEFTRQEPNELLKKYRTAAKTRAEGAESHHKHHHRHRHHEDRNSESLATQYQSKVIQNEHKTDLRVSCEVKNVEIGSSRSTSSMKQQNWEGHSVGIGEKTEESNEAALHDSSFETYRADDTYQSSSYSSNDKYNRHQGERSGGSYRGQYSRGGRNFGSQRRDNFSYRNRRDQDYHRDRGERNRRWERTNTGVYHNHGDRDYRTEYRNFGSTSSQPKWRQPPLYSNYSSNPFPNLSTPPAASMPSRPPPNLADPRQIPVNARQPSDPRLHSTGDRASISYMNPPPLPPDFQNSNSNRLMGSEHSR